MSKIGPHVINCTPAALDWSRRAPIVKAMNPAAVQALREAPDGAVRVYRHYFDNQDTAHPAADYARSILNGLGGYRHPLLYVELLNELHPDGWAEQARLLREAAAVLHAEGVKVCGPSWATGNGTPEQWAAYVDATRGHLDAAALHAYWSPRYRLTQWNALRYRTFWRPGDPMLLLTEVGEDVVNDAPGAQPASEGGYRKNGTPDGIYLDELAEFDRELERDSYVLGAMVFTAGPSYDWMDYDTDRLDVSRFYSIPSTPPDAADSQGGEEMTDQERDQKIAQILKQNAHLTAAIRAIREDRWTGADGVDGHLVAMTGRDDFQRAFPPSPKA